MENKLNSCKNCEEQFNASYKFCPYCGQQAKEDLTVKVLFYNTISNYFSFDARFFKSFFPLLFKPGLVPKRFVEGKRLKYLHPAQYYLFVSVVFFFIFSFKVREYNANVDKALETGFEAVKAKDSIKSNAIDSTLVLNTTQPLVNNPNIKAVMDEQELKVLDSTLNENLTKSKTTNYSLSYDPKKLDSLIEIGAPEEEQLRSIGMKENAGFIQRAFVKQALKFHKQRGGGIVQAFLTAYLLRFSFYCHYLH